MKRNGSRAIVCLALFILVLGGLGTLYGTPLAHADTSLIYMVDVTTAAGGVYARYAPHTSATNHTTGYGVYPGQTVQLLCGVIDGDTVGPYNNHTWHFVGDVSNPGEGNFWLNDHYVDSPNVANQLAPGESKCKNESSNPLAISNPITSYPSTPYMVGNCAIDFGGYIVSGLGHDPGETHDNSQTSVCVHIQTSAPDHMHHRQFVGKIEAEAPYIDPPGCPDTNYLLEIWGDGFYKNIDCTAPTTWAINKWVADGTNICAAISNDFTDGTLGEFNQDRQITCIHIKA